MVDRKLFEDDMVVRVLECCIKEGRESAIKKYGVSDSNITSWANMTGLTKRIGRKKTSRHDWEAIKASLAKIFA